MSDIELLRLLDSRAEDIVDVLERKRAAAKALLTSFHALEDEIVRLSTVRGSVMAAARDIRSGGSRADAAAEKEKGA